MRVLPPNPVQSLVPSLGPGGESLDSRISPSLYFAVTPLLAVSALPHILAILMSRYEACQPSLWDNVFWHSNSSGVTPCYSKQSFPLPPLKLLMLGLWPSMLHHLPFFIAINNLSLGHFRRLTIFPVASHIILHNSFSHSCSIWSPLDKRCNIQVFQFLELLTSAL